MSPGPPYYTYILANRHRTVLYIGMTNNLRRRLQEHRAGQPDSFTTRYNVTELVYFERYKTPLAAIEREKQLKRWSRDKKEALIQSENPDMDTLPVPIE